MAGRPKGSQNKDKPFKQALQLAISEADGDVKKLRRVADALVAKAISGDVPAIAIIADRLDGKVTQMLAGDPDGEPIRISKVMRTIIDPKTGDPDR